MKVPVIIKDFTRYVQQEIDIEISKRKEEGKSMELLLDKLKIFIDLLEEEYLKSGYLSNPAHFYLAHVEKRIVIGKYSFKTTGEALIFEEKHNLTGFAIVRGRDILNNRAAWKIDNFINILKEPL